MTTQKPNSMLVQLRAIQETEDDVALWWLLPEIIRVVEQYEVAKRERDEIGAALGEPCAECGHIDWRSDGYFESVEQEWLRLAGVQAARAEELQEQLEACEADRSSLSQSADHLQEQLEAMRRNAEFGEACLEICSRSRHPWWEISQRAKEIIGVNRFTGYGSECEQPGASSPALTPSASGSDVGHAARRLATGASDAEEGSGTDPDSPRGVSSPAKERQ